MNKMEVVVPYLTYEQMNIIRNSQTLWERLGFLVRSLMISVLRDPERTQASVNQLYNLLAVYFHNYLQIFYGYDVAQKFTNYFTNFITAMWRLFEATSANDKELIDYYTSEIYNAADELAAFLANINLFWSVDQWKSFLHQYIRTTLDEYLALANKDFDMEYQIFNRLQELTVLIGDYMARGIISSSSLPLPT